MKIEHQLQKIAVQTPGKNRKSKKPKVKETKEEEEEDEIEEEEEDWDALLGLHHLQGPVIISVRQTLDRGSQKHQDGWNTTLWNVSGRISRHFVPFFWDLFFEHKEEERMNFPIQSSQTLPIEHGAFNGKAYNIAFPSSTSSTSSTISWIATQDFQLDSIIKAHSALWQVYHLLSTHSYSRPELMCHSNRYFICLIYEADGEFWR